MSDLVDLTGGSANVYPGPILGDPEPCLQLSAGDYLTSLDMKEGEPGDAGGLAGFGVEFWFRTDSVSPIVDNSLCRGPVCASGTWQWQVELTTSGAIRFTVFDEAVGAHTATTAGVVAGHWYHLVATVSGAPATLYVWLDGVQKASASFTGHTAKRKVTFPGSAGYEDLRLGDPYSGTTNTINFLHFSDLAFYRYGQLSARIQARFQAGSARGFNQGATGPRIDAMLDALGSSAPRRLDHGQRNITPRYMAGQSGSESLLEAVAAEAVDAALFCAADGALVFLDSSHRSRAPYSNPQSVFGDGGGDELPYEDIDVDYSDSFIANTWNVTREGTAQTPGSLQTASDQASIDRYGDRPQSLSGIPLENDAIASTVASAMLAKYKDAHYRVLSFALPLADPESALEVLRRDLMDKITLLRTPPGGGARIQQDPWIQKIELRGANDGKPWSARWGVSPL